MKNQRQPEKLAGPEQFDRPTWGREIASIELPSERRSVLDRPELIDYVVRVDQESTDHRPRRRFDRPRSPIERSARGQ